MQRSSSAVDIVFYWSRFTPFSMTLHDTFHSSVEHHVYTSVTLITHKMTQFALLLPHGTRICKTILDHMLIHGILASQVSTWALNNILALKMEYELIAVRGQIESLVAAVGWLKSSSEFICATFLSLICYNQFAVLTILTWLPTWSLLHL